MTLVRSLFDNFDRRVEGRRVDFEIVSELYHFVQHFLYRLCEIHVIPSTNIVSVIWYAIEWCFFPFPLFIRYTYQSDLS